MQTQQNGHDPINATTFHTDSGLHCPSCQKPMTLRQVSYSARRKDLTFVCLVCAWRTTKTSDSWQG